MEPDLDDSLYITHGRVVWNIADTAPQKILVSVEGNSPRQAMELVKRSRERIRLF